MILVAATGWGQDGDKRLSLEAGFDHHMAKPIALDAVQKLLGTARFSGRELARVESSGSPPAQASAEPGGRRA